MEKLWDDLSIHTGPSKTVDMTKVLFFSSSKNLGDIRDEFDAWSINDLFYLTEEFYYSSTQDHGESEEYDFGELDRASFHPFRECQIMQSLAGTIWGLCSKKKKFF